MCARACLLSKESDSDNVPVFFPLGGGECVLQFPFFFFFFFFYEWIHERAIDRKRARTADDSNAREVSRTSRRR
jgi:hypothetical protein